jgi:hypothetical protein
MHGEGARLNNGARVVESIDQTLCIPVAVRRRKRSAESASGTGEGSSASGVAARHDNDSQAEVDESPPRKRLRLDVYHNKCLPNLPSDLVCPVCRVIDRRTLMLTEISYVTRPGTERRVDVGRAQQDWPLTFTPAAARRSPGGKDEGDIASRLRGDLVESFPPSYPEPFLYSHVNYGDHETDTSRKHAISIHCEGFGRFGVLASAAVRYGSNFIEQTGPLETVMRSTAWLERP